MQELREQTTQARSYMDQPEKDKSLEVLSNGMGFEAIAGIGTAVLAVLGLAGIMPLSMTAIAAMVAGTGLLLGGGSIASRLDYLRAHAASHTEYGDLTEGMGAEFIAGLAGVVLGILSLIGIIPATLLPIAAVVFGGGLLVGIGAVGRLNKYPTFAEGDAATDFWARQATSSAAGIQLLVGLASITLGILSLVGFSWMTLTLVALLCVGCATWISGMSLTSRLQAVLHHHLHHW